MHPSGPEPTPAVGAVDAGVHSWAPGGLRFSCTRCGNCCRNHGQHAYVYLTSPEVAALAAHLHLEESEFLEHYCRQDGGWTILRPNERACPLLDEDGSCSVYQARPMQCRTWPFWEENLTSEQAWRAAAAISPGIGTGPLHSAEEVAAIAHRNEAWYESDGQDP